MLKNRYNIRYINSLKIKMFIQTDRESNYKAIKRVKYQFILFGVIILGIALLLTLCKPKGQVEQYLTTPPSLYNIEQIGEIPKEQQWIISSELINQNHEVQDSNLRPFLNNFKGPAWNSSDYVNSQTASNLYVYIDFAGKQTTRKDIEFYLQPICKNNIGLQPCIAQSSVESFTQAGTTSNTIYQTITSNKYWYYYGSQSSDVYQVNPSQNFKFVLKSNLPDGYQPAWIRVTYSDKPITTKKTNFFTSNKYHVYFKFLLLFLPLLILIEFQRGEGFSSQQALVTGGLITLLATINTLIWDLNYMVIGCLIISFSGIFYAFSNSTYKLIYIIGYLMIMLNAYQYYQGLTHDFYTQVGLLTLIGFYILFKEPE